MNTRRSFLKTTGMGVGTLAVSSSFLGVSACDNVFNDILKYVPIALTAVDTIVTMINPVEGSAVTALSVMVKAALSDIQTAVIAYENADPSQKTTLLGKISTAIAAAEQSLQQFWSDLKLPDNQMATLVEGIINIILSTLASFLPSLPAPAFKMRATLRSVQFSPKKRSLGEFKHDLNAQFIAAGKAPIFK